MPPKTADLLIRNGLILCMDEAHTQLRGGDVAVTGDRITAIGQNLGLEADVEIDARGHAVLPGTLTPICTKP